MTDTPAIEFSGVTKDYTSGSRGLRLRALDNLTLEIPRGQIFGLLGPNGSGKSTAIKLILGLLAPTIGEIRVLGVPAGIREARNAIGYLPEAPEFYRYLSGREFLRFHGQLCGLPRSLLESRIDNLLVLTEMTFAADRRVGSYSKGMLQRIGLGQALIHDPALLILDEPTAGVDPEGAAEMGELVLKLKTLGKTILITSHLLDQMEEICDRVAILDRGQLLREAAVSELVEESDAFVDSITCGSRALCPTRLCAEAAASGVKPDLRKQIRESTSDGSVPLVKRALHDVFLSTIRTHRDRARAASASPTALGVE